MTIDDYKRNLRGVNDNSDFSIEFLVRSCQTFILVESELQKAKYLRLDSQEGDCHARRAYRTARV